MPVHRYANTRQRTDNPSNNDSAQMLQQMTVRAQILQHRHANTCQCVQHDPQDHGTAKSETRTHNLRTPHTRNAWSRI
eukprot:676917-Rhodomonas_salina.1